MSETVQVPVMDPEIERQAGAVDPMTLGEMVKNSQVTQLKLLGGAEGLGRKLGCLDLTKGLETGTDFSAIKAKYGKNELEPPYVPSYMSLVWDGLHDITICMLIAAAIVSLVLAIAFEEDKSTAWIEGAAILVAVIFVVNFQAWTDYNNASTFRRQQLELENTKEVHVLRGGESVTIHPRELVVGDVLRIGVGNILPGDGILLEGQNIKMDEAALTGESKIIEKAPFNINDPGAKIGPFLLSGTSVMNGQGRMLVLAVGSNSMQGKILAQVSEQRRQGAASKDVPKEVSAKEDSLKEIPSQHVSEILAAAQHRTSSARRSSVQLPPIDPTLEILQSFTSLRNFETHIEKKKQRRIRRFLINLCSFNQIEEGGTMMEKLDRLALDIGKFGFFIASIVFIVMCARWSVSEFQDNGVCFYFNGNRTDCELSRDEGCFFHNDDNFTCDRFWRGVDDFTKILQFFIIAVTILVVVVPEGLPLAVTLSLSIAMRHMARDNNQVKDMESSETMGSATTICSDKTGTLTENRMTCVRLTFGVNGEVFKAGPGGNPSLGAAAAKAINADIVRSFAEGCALASEKTSMATQDAAGKWSYVGNPTECGLLRLAAELGHDPTSIRSSEKFAPEPGSSLDWGVKVFPFSSSRKRMSIVVSFGGGKGYRLYSKGAPQYIFDACISYLDASTGTVMTLDGEKRRILDARVDDFAHEAMRTMAVAYRDFAAVPSEGWDAFIDERGSTRSLNSESGAKDDGAADTKPRACETRLVLLAVVGIEDPLRPTIVEAIKDCRRSGVDVRMCTGDALETAVAISYQCGILRDQDMELGPDGRKRPKEFFAMTGAEFDERVHDRDHKKPLVMRRAYDFQTKQVGEMRALPFKVDRDGKKVLNQAKFDEIWPKLRVLARCLPDDKLTLVRGIRQSRVFADSVYCSKLEKEFGIKIFPDYQVVAVTGDGTNDAPALKEADVGFAMGIVGTDIAKQACDIILMDDNFASIVKAVKWGRNVFDSISKFVTFQLTVNLTAVIIATVGSFAFTRSPLGAVQMLWVNLIMDSFASFALSSEKPSAEILDRAPYGKRRPMISRIMAFNITGQAIYQLVILFAIVFNASWLPGADWKTGGVPQYPPAPAQGIVYHAGDFSKELHGPTSSVHWTIVFNVFVMMQLFNELNSRKLQTVERLKTTWVEWNVFTGITRNPIFLVIVVGTFVVQIIIVQFTGETFRVRPLSFSQWIFSIGLGAGSLLWQFVINWVIVLTDRFFSEQDKATQDALRRKVLNSAHVHEDVIQVKVTGDEA